MSDLPSTITTIPDHDCESALLSCRSVAPVVGVIDRRASPVTIGRLAQSREHEPNEAEPRSSSKRRRLNTSDFAPRKRVSHACQFCRVRKTKCDSVKPRCGFCIRNDAKCIYTATEQVQEPTFTIQAQHEPTSNQGVMDRLGNIGGVLPQDPQKRYDGSAPAPASTGESSGKLTTPLDAHTPESLQTPATLISWARLPHGTNDSSPTQMRNRLPYATLRCESLLRWPALAPVISEAAAEIDSFPLSAGYTEVRRIQGTTFGRGFNEDAFVALCEDFLEAVHPRNPILDDAELLSHARYVTENGLAWDSASCLTVSR